jgi:hypothetical protein
MIYSTVQTSVPNSVLCGNSTCGGQCCGDKNIAAAAAALFAALIFLAPNQNGGSGSA